MNKATLIFLAISILFTIAFSSCNSKHHYTKEEKDKLPRIKTAIVEVITPGENKYYSIIIPNGVDAHTGVVKTKKVKATLNYKIKKKLEDQQTELMVNDTIIVIPRYEGGTIGMGQFEIIGAHMQYLRIDEVY